MKILWIDDDRLFVRPLIDDLIDAKHEVMYVHDIEDGYDIVKGRWSEFDRIFVDIMMTAITWIDVPMAEGGMRSGMYFLEKIRDELPEALKRCVVVSIVRDAEAKAHLSALGVKYIFKSRATAINILE